PIIYRATEQWFIALDEAYRDPKDKPATDISSLRDRAIASVDEGDMSVTPEGNALISAAEHARQEPLLEEFLAGVEERGGNAGAGIGGRGGQAICGEGIGCLVYRFAG